MNPNDRPVRDHRFEAMGCEVVVGGGTTEEHLAIERLFRERDLAFSRFIPSSELNRVNAAAGCFVEVSMLFAETLRIALQAASETGGLIDPTLGSAIEAAGYTHDFADLLPDPEPPGETEGGAWRSVLVRGRWVSVPRDVRLDLNGVVKALAVDDALRVLAGNGFVSAGGDLAARGELTVGLPGGDGVLLRRGALATSGDAKRWWLRAGRIQHHLIDPRWGRPAVSPWAQVTACGATCLAADIAAKAAYLLGDGGPGWLDDRRIPARFLDRQGRETTNQAWDAGMREAAACI